MKVHVIGPSGAGKTTLARELGKCLSLPVYPLDPIAFTDSHWTIRSLPDKGRRCARSFSSPAGLRTEATLAGRNLC